MDSSKAVHRPGGSGNPDRSNIMTITKITVTGLNAANMGEATDADAAGYRQWLATELAAEFPGAEIETIEQDTTYGVAVEVTDGEEYQPAMDAVQEFAGHAWDRCNWGWVSAK